MESNESKEVILKVKIELQDYRNFYLQNYRKYLTLMGVFCFISLNLTVLIFSHIETYDISEIISILEVTVPIGILTSGLLILSNFFRLNYIAKRNFKRDKLLQQEMELSFTDIAIVISAGSITGEIIWENIYKVREFKYGYCIYTARDKALTIPKRFLSDAVQIKNLTEILQTSLPSKKVKLKKSYQ